jgi:hypothetical protein
MGLGGEALVSKDRRHNRARLRSGEKEPVMTLKPGPPERARTVSHISHAAQARVDQRVKEILARRVALDRVRRAGQQLN